MAKKSSKQPVSIAEALAVPPGPVDLRSYDPRATPGFDGSKSDGEAELVEMGPAPEVCTHQGSRQFLPDTCL